MTTAPPNISLESNVLRALNVGFNTNSVYKVVLARVPMPNDFDARRAYAKRSPVRLLDDPKRIGFVLYTNGDEPTRLVPHAFEVAISDKLYTTIKQANGPDGGTDKVLIEPKITYKWGQTIVHDTLPVFIDSSTALMSLVSANGNAFVPLDHPFEDGSVDLYAWYIKNAANARSTKTCPRRYTLPASRNSAHSNWLYADSASLVIDGTHRPLYDHQKHAVRVMIDIERAVRTSDASTVSSLLLHHNELPCVCINGLNFNVRPEDGALVPRTTFDGTVARVCATGGILGDAMGLGKTCTMAALMVHRPAAWTRSLRSRAAALADPREAWPMRELRATLVVCTRALVYYWSNEIEQHTSLSVLTLTHKRDLNTVNRTDTWTNYDVVIASSETLKRQSAHMPRAAWWRLVVDEGHTLLGSPVLRKWLQSVHAVTRWYVSGTPVRDYKVARRAREFLGVRLNPYAPYGVPVDPVTELKLVAIMTRVLRVQRAKHEVRMQPVPRPTDEVLFVELTPFERTLYDAQRTRTKQRAACCHPSLVINTSAAIVDTLDAMVPRMLDMQRASILAARGRLDRLESATTLSSDHTARVANARVEYEDAKRYLTYFEGMLETLGTDDDECVVCLEPRDKKRDKLCFTPCGHVFHSVCMQGIMKASAVCPLCRADLRGSDIKYTMPSCGSDASLPDDKLVKEHGSKFASVIDYIRRLPDDARVIIFSQFTPALRRIEQALAGDGLSCARILGTAEERNATIKRFQAGNLRVVLLSSRQNADGITLTRATHVLLTEPAPGKTEAAARAIEAQAVARAVRPGQTRSVRVVRFVTVDTVEKSLFNLNTKNAVDDHGRVYKRQRVAPPPAVASTSTQ